MSVAMTNCGAAGWVTDRAGYRYDHRDPESGRHWPPMPDEFAALAVQAAARAGLTASRPTRVSSTDTSRGTRLSLHQDRNERDLEAPIVSVSLGLPAVFLFGGSSSGSGTARPAGSTATWPSGEVPAIRN